MAHRALPCADDLLGVVFLGGGVDLVCACDIRLVSDDAFFVIEETNIGMTADVGTYPRISRLLPDAIVRELSFTGRKMLADEAHQRGFVNHQYSNQDELLAKAMEMASSIASKAPNAVYGCKKLINYSLDHSTQDTLDYIALWNASKLDLMEMQAAMQARMTKQAATYNALPPRKTSVAKD